ncbi:MAG TPA: DUF2905 family protein [Chloroflexota bacterium]|nr:DUF2905 family protein [Chloroflexota bacterium]
MPGEPGASLDQVGRLLIIGGLVVVALGVLVLLVSRVPAIGRLPGDLSWRGDGWSVYVPLASSLLLSLVLSVLLTIVVNLLGRR